MSNLHDRLKEIAKSRGEAYSSAHQFNELSGEAYGLGILDAIWPQIQEIETFLIMLDKEQMDSSEIKWRLRKILG